MTRFSSAVPAAFIGLNCFHFVEFLGKNISKKRSLATINFDLVTAFEVIRYSENSPWSKRESDGSDER